ncbi:Ig-like domain-containing protein [Parvularcula flava]|uniref:Ig-like domain-containing protein n=1 Tax=Aquisalinus luteolus TaxID=1566827 RepID=A0A8J3EQ88_9PROT|nr:Ig-like domain-containing protein [Aquisalinus luteolus]NHK26933.1 Ig-like domain-containing protein [Aquisalinus luteolus]GGH93854.1 hypothetical protein GCM10011355_06670 [Aquisalinus luteolus]
MKRTLLAACAAIAICGAIPVVLTPAHAQAMDSLSVTQLEDRLTGMMLADGQAAASTQAYAQTYRELKVRMESKPTADQLNRFQNFPKPVQTTKAEDSPGGQPAGDANIVYFGFDREKLSAEANQTLDEVRDAYAPDHQPGDLPEVARTSPARNADGVDPGTSFVLTFSEPMDEAAVEDNFVIRSFTEEREGSDGSYPPHSTGKSKDADDGEPVDAAYADANLYAAEKGAVSSRDGARFVGSDTGGLIVEDEDVGKERPTASGEKSDGGQWYDGLDTSDVQGALPGTDSPEDAYDKTLGGPIVKDRLWFFVGASQTSLPQAGYGVEVTADDEQFVAETDDHLSGTTFGGAYLGGTVFTPRDEFERFSYMQRKWRGRASAFAASLSYTEAEGSSFGSVPAGGNGTGVVYFDFADDDATGLFYGSAGSDVETHTDYENFRFAAGRKVYHGISPDWYWGCYHGFFFDYSGTEHEFRITTPTYPDIYTFGLQDLTERYAGVEVGPFFGRKFGKVNTFARPLVNIGYREADLDAKEDTFCGACYYSQNVPIHLEDDDSGLTYGVSFDAGLSAQIADGVDIGLLYGARWRADRAAIDNPESGDDLFVDNQPTRLSSEDELDQRLVFTIGKSW